MIKNISKSIYKYILGGKYTVQFLTRLTNVIAIIVSDTTHKRTDGPRAVVAKPSVITHYLSSRGSSGDLSSCDKILQEFPIRGVGFPRRIHLLSRSLLFFHLVCWRHLFYDFYFMH